MAPVFEWDLRKAEANLAKHGVPFDEAKTVFGDQDAVIVYDPDHSQREQRLIALGISAVGRLIALAFTVRAGSIRIINARRANRRERRRYEKT